VSITVTVRPKPTVAVTGDSSICRGDATTLTASGGFLYFWSNGVVSPTLTLAPTADSTVSVFTVDNNGSTSDPVVRTVRVLPTPVITVTPLDTTICSNSVATYRLLGAQRYVFSRVGSTTPYATVNAATAATPVNFVIPAADANVYDVIGFNVPDSCESAPVRTIITVNGGGIPQITTADTLLCIGETTSLIASGGDAYYWSLSNDPVAARATPLSTAGTLVVTGTTPGTVFYYLFTDQAGCPNLRPDSIAIRTDPSPTGTGLGTDVVACDSTTLTLAANPNLQYQWSTGPNDTLNTVTLRLPSFPSGVATEVRVTVTNRVTGCSSADTILVTLNPTPATPTVGSNSPVCARSAINLTANAVPGATYAWTGPNGFTSNQQNPSIPNASAANAGTYSLTVTVNGCTSPAATVTVVVNDPATPTVGSNSPVCETNTLNLTAQGSPGVTYSWTGPNGFTSNQQNPSIPNASAANAGVYRVVTTLNGCQSLPDSVVVTILPKPPTPTASSNSPICGGDTLILTCQPGIPGGVYTWTGPNGFIDNRQTVELINSTTAQSGTYSVTITVNGCVSDAGTVNVVVNPLPATPVVQSLIEVCETDAINLTASSDPGATYSWTGPNGFTSNLQNPTLSPATLILAGDYSVVAISAAGCTSAVAITQVIVNPNPDLSVVVADSGFCTGLPTTLRIVSSQVGVTYNAFLGAVQVGGPVLGTGFDIPIAINNTLLAPGANNITIQATLGNCTRTLTRVPVLTVEPLPDASITVNGPVNICPQDAGSQTILSGVSQPGVSYQWFLNGVPIPGATGNILALDTSARTGIYNLLVTATASGCQDSSATGVRIAAGPYPTAAFTSDPLPDSTLGGTSTLFLKGTTVNFINRSQNYTRQMWYFGNGDSSTARNPIYTYTDTGTYVVTLVVFNDAGCADTVQVGFYYIRDRVLNFIPNVFTPNGSGDPYNDCFCFPTPGFTGYNMVVYSRWGHVVFDNGGNPNTYWDGTKDGTPCPEDAYVYVFQGTRTDGTLVELSGTVTLIR